MLKKVILVLAVVMLFGAGLYTFNYFTSSNDVPYQLAEKQILKSTQLQEHVGGISQVRLSPFGIYRERTAGSNGEAIFDVDVLGRKAKLTIRIKTILSDGVWRLDSAEVEGQKVVISN